MRNLVKKPNQLLAYAALAMVTAFGCLLTCSTPFNKEDQKTILRKQKKILEVSETIQAVIVPITKSFYQGDEIPGLFASMRETSNEFCKILWNMKKARLSKAKNFIVKSKVALYLSEGSRGIRGLIAGCWNFFIMNDKRPDIDFQLVKQRYSQQKFDCYSVGFLQPYIMHSVLNCSSLTMLDLDWRIIDGHSQLIDKIRRNELSTASDLAKSIASLKIGWVAHSGPVMKEKNVVTFPFYCKKHNQQELCQRHMLGFQKAVNDLNRVRFNLAALHEASFTNTDSSLTRVVFLSNAIESIYTRKWQFNKMLKNLTSVMNIGSKAVMIHHAGGMQEYGIYELTKIKENIVSTKTVCRDIYTNLAINRVTKYYTTYFEEVSTNKKAPRCRGLVSKVDSKL